MPGKAYLYAYSVSSDHLVQYPLNPIGCDYLLQTHCNWQIAAKHIHMDVFVRNKCCSFAVAPVPKGPWTVAVKTVVVAKAAATLHEASLFQKLVAVEAALALALSISVCTQF